jgi:hypothetical protein
MPGRFRHWAKVAESQFAKANRSDQRFLNWLNFLSFAVVFH